MNKSPSDSQEVIVEASKLTHVYPGGYEALRGVDVKIFSGQVVGIVGRNGSGKTTLVKHFNGLLKPTSGQVLIQGKSTADLKISQLAARVGYVFQNPDHQLFLDSVFDEASYGPKNLGFSESDTVIVVENVLEQLGLWNRRLEHPFRLTRTERKLLSIACVLTMRPSIVVLDEPTTGQDEHHTGLITKVINQLHSQGNTLIIISHDMSLVAETCHRVIVLANGQVLIDGPPRATFGQGNDLKQANIKPPEITQMGIQAGLSRIVLTVEEMVEQMKELSNRREML